MGHVREDNLELMLKGLQLEKYITLFNKRGVNFDTFVNMSVEDMSLVGIKSRKDQALLVKTLEPLSHIYRDLYDLPSPQQKLIIVNVSSQIRMALGYLIAVSRMAKEKKTLKNTLVDSIHSNASTIVLLAERALQSVSLIEDDMKKLSSQMEKKKSRGIIIGTVCGVGIICVFTYLMRR